MLKFFLIAHESAKAQVLTPTKWINCVSVLCVSLAELSLGGIVETCCSVEAAG